jgi:hypothetical protein
VAAKMRRAGGKAVIALGALSQDVDACRHHRRWRPPLWRSRAVPGGCDGHAGGT